MANHQRLPSSSVGFAPAGSSGSPPTLRISTGRHVTSSGSGTAHQGRSGRSALTAMSWASFGCGCPPTPFGGATFSASSPSAAGSASGTPWLRRKRFSDSLSSHGVGPRRRLRTAGLSCPAVAPSGASFDSSSMFASKRRSCSARRRRATSKTSSFSSRSATSDTAAVRASMMLRYLSRADVSRAAVPRVAVLRCESADAGVGGTSAPSCVCSAKASAGPTPARPPSASARAFSETLRSMRRRRSARRSAGSRPSTVGSAPMAARSAA
mmetsp:Transcript_2913/g.8416  ORF Transcript_2913/g.8416 Transcript_2913/m.8416 type:complete len:268 (+) Transcript_2913:572-1375(+)